MTKLKYISAAVLLFMVSFVGGCCGMDAKTAEADEPFCLEMVDYDGLFTIYKDNRTGVQYLVYDWSNGSAMCVMVDAEGKPLVDKE